MASYFFLLMPHASLAAQATRWTRVRYCPVPFWPYSWRLLPFLLVCGLQNCQQAAPTTQQTESVAADAPPSSVPAATTQLATSASPSWSAPITVDTLLRLQGQRYHLRLQAELDSTQRLSTLDSSATGATESVQGYDGRYTFTLRDSLNQLVFRRQLHKADFFPLVGKAVVVPSEAAVPSLLGYSAPLHALIFTLSFVVPDTDWGMDVVVLLNEHGRVVRLSEGIDYGGGPESTPALSRDGRVLLTASEILRAHQPALSLHRPQAELRGAFLLNESTVLTVYALGHYQWVPTSGGRERQFVESPALQTAPNAFVRHVPTGQVLHQFRYDGYVEELGYTIPRFFVRAAQTWYLLAEEKGLYRLPSSGRRAPTLVPFTAMTPFVGPQRASERRFTQYGAQKQYAFYVDTLAPAQMRYQLLSGGD